MVISSYHVIMCEELIVQEVQRDNECSSEVNSVKHDTTW